MTRSYLTPDEVAAELRVSRGWVLAREMREARARLLTEIDRRDFGIDREPPDRSGNAAG